MFRINGQESLIETMQAFGYDVSMNGACSGTSQMAVHAILTRDFPYFQNLIKQIHEVHQKVIVNFQESIDKKLNELLPQLKVKAEEKAIYKATSASVEEFKELQEKEFAKLLEKKRIELLRMYFEKYLFTLKQSKKDSELKEIIKLEYEIRALFEGICLYQNFHKYRELLPPGDPILRQEAAVLIAPFVRPKKLQHDITENIRFSGRYDENQLNKLFKTLSYHVRYIKEPIALVLRSHNHAICIGYYPDTKTWVLINPNQPPGFNNIKNISEVVENVLFSFTTPEIPILHLGVFIYTEKNIEDKLKAWSKTKSFQDIHNVSRHSDDSNWFYLAVMFNDVNAVHAFLLQGNIDIERCGPDNYFSPLHLAVAKNNFSIVKELLYFGADINAKNKFDINALMIAFSQNNVKIFELLLQHGALKKIDALAIEAFIDQVIIAGENNLFFIDSLLAYGISANRIVEKILNCLDVIIHSSSFNEAQEDKIINSIVNLIQHLSKNNLIEDSDLFFLKNKIQDAQKILAAEYDKLKQNHTKPSIVKKEIVKQDPVKQELAKQKIIF